VRPHPATDDFSVPEVNGSWKGKCTCDTHRSRCTNDGANVARILDGIQDEEPKRIGHRQVLQPVRRHLGDRQNSLRRFRLGGREKVALGHLVGGYVSLAEPLEKRRRAWGVGEAAGDERAAYHDVRAEQLLDAPHTFGDEQALSLTGFSAMQIAGEGESFQRHTECVLPCRDQDPTRDKGLNMRRRAASAAIAVLLVMSAGCGISQQQEVEIGTQQRDQVNSQLPIIQDVAVNRYLNILGDSLAHVTARRDLEWHFYIVNTNDFNAFALPGGFIYVNRGVIERATRMDELASVIGHEIGHVVLRHSVKQMEQMQGANVGVTIACVLTGVCNSGIAQAGINVGAQAVFAKFSRSDEAEADAAGIDELVRAGINPNGMVTMFEKLLAERQSRPSALESWFTDHPLEEDRIQASRDQIARINPAIIRTLTSNSQAFNDFRARVHSLPPPPVASRGGRGQ
jgi:beta-barrel assembly-enhancing protease